MEFEYLRYRDTVETTELYTLMNRYGADVWKYAYAITKNRELANDVSQEVFVKAFNKISTFRGQSTVKTWLLSITRNTAINEMKSAYFRKVLLFGIVKSNERVHSAEAAYLERQSVSEIWSVILELSRKLREVLVLDLKYELTVPDCWRYQKGP